MIATPSATSSTTVDDDAIAEMPWPNRRRNESCSSASVSSTAAVGRAPKNFLGHLYTPLRSRESVAEAETLLELFEIARYGDTLAATLPQGVRKLLDIGMAVAGSPRLLLLDEPTSGISIEEKFGLMQVVMSALRKREITVLFVEHDMEIVRELADRVVCLHRGRIISEGTMDTVSSDPLVRRAYLGLQ